MKEEKLRWQQRRMEHSERIKESSRRTPKSTIEKKTRNIMNERNILLEKGRKDKVKFYGRIFLNKNIIMIKKTITEEERKKNVWDMIELRVQ